MKTIKPILFLVVLIIVAAGGYYLGTRSAQDPGAAPGETTANEGTLYTCGMHPNVIQDEPGLCPICEMKLTPLRRDSATGNRQVKYYQSTMHPGEISQMPGKDSMGMEMEPVYEENAAMAGMSTITIDPVTIQNMAIRTATLTNGPLRRVIRTVGTLDHSEPGLADVTTKVTGWIEKLYVDTTGSHVHRGDPLLELYSPELYSAQTEYLMALNSSNTPGGDALLDTARTKLRFWDISDTQLDRIERTGKPLKTLQIESPLDGYVMMKNAVQGQQVEPGMRLYQIANHDIVWIEAAIYEQDLAFVSISDRARLTVASLPGRVFEGEITFIHPTLDEQTRTARVRVELANPDHELRPGMFATVEISHELSADALLVPESAVLRSGHGNTVFVTLADGKFEPRTVTLGARAENDQFQVLDGLNTGERVVVSGQFMLDSESQLREAIQKMLNPPAPGAATVIPTNTATHPTESGPHPTLHTCPMAICETVSDQPGRCPKCNMKLVETGTVEHGELMEANWRTEHQH